MPAERWIDSDNVVARVNLPNMRGPVGRRVEIYAEAVRGLLALEPDRSRRDKYLEFIDIHAGLTDNEYRRYRQQYAEGDTVMPGVIQRAREEAHIEGERTVLERLLRRRFGDLRPDIDERLHKASSTDLEAWADNLLDAETLDDVFGQARSSAP